MYPRGGACTVSVAYPTYGFAAEKDIPKVVSDGEINPNKKTVCQVANSLFVVKKSIRIVIFYANTTMFKQS